MQVVSKPPAGLHRSHQGGHWRGSPETESRCVARRNPCAGADATNWWSSKPYATWLEFRLPCRPRPPSLVLHAGGRGVPASPQQGACSSVIQFAAERSHRLGFAVRHGKLLEPNGTRTEIARRGRNSGRRHDGRLPTPSMVRRSSVSRLVTSSSSLCASSSRRAARRGLLAARARRLPFVDAGQQAGDVRDRGHRLHLLLTKPYSGVPQSGRWGGIASLGRPPRHRAQRRGQRLPAAMVLAQARACAVSVTPRNSRRNSTAADKLAALLESGTDRGGLGFCDDHHAGRMVTRTVEGKRPLVARLAREALAGR